ncbi:MAG: hypothetical protein J2P27_01550 [Actinobacteria bacterium]|nr:hypothetical protein [Actinomycetota bacterium]
MNGGRLQAVPDVGQLAAAAAQRAATEPARWLRANPVIVAAVGLIVAQLGWKAYLLSRFYFRQDDFLLLDRALSHGLNPNYLFAFSGGHLRPGGLFVFWLITRLSPYDWPLASIVTIAALAAAGVLMLRLLLILFGRSPAILIPLIIFLFTPLTLAGLSFWTTVTDWLPLQLAMLAATNSHVRYLRSGGLRHVVAAAAWLGTGLLFDMQGALVPLLLFALTSAYLVPGRWLAAATRTLRSFWHAWTSYGVLTAAYLVVFLIKLQTSSEKPINPEHLSSVLSLAATMLRVGFVPVAVGGPWRWFVPGGDYGFATETPFLTQATWVLAALIVGVSLWYRRHALRSWLILAGWLLLADFGPVAIARLTEYPADLLGTDTHYVADSAPVVAICVGLAFWPLIGEQDPYRVRRPRSVPLAASAFALTGAFLVGSILSGVTYLSSTSSARTRSYIDTARSALASARPGTVILSASTPWYVMYAGFRGSVTQTSNVLGPLAPEHAGIRFVTVPTGAITDLKMFDSRGRLRPALAVGASSLRPARSGRCWPVRSAVTRIPLSGYVFRYAWIIRLSYSGPPTTLQLELGTAVRDVVLPAGRRDIYIPVTGGGSAVLVRSLSGEPAACIARLTVRLMYTTNAPAVSG